MSTELAPVATIGYLESTTADAPSKAVAMLTAHAQMMDMAYDLAFKLVKTAMVPDIYRGKPEDATAAILYGLEIGLNPIQSLQQVFSVYGTPAIYARTMVALVKRHGYMVKTVELTDTSATVWGKAPDGTDEEVTFTIEDAYKAGWVAQKDPETGDWLRSSKGKIIGNTKYLTEPRSMLYAKAAAILCRHIAPEVLLGMPHTREDLESEPEPESARPVRVRSERITADDIVAATTSPDIGDDTGAANQPDATPAEGDTAVSEQVDEPDAPADIADDEPASNSDTEPESAPATSSAEPESTATHEDQADGPPKRKPMATVAQLQKLNILIERHGVTEKDDKLAYLSEQFKRRFTSSKELTRVEASELIEYLERPVDEQETEQTPANHDADGGAR